MARSGTFNPNKGLTGFRRFGVRISDQIFWSAGFFLFNIVCSLSMAPAEYSILALTTSIAFIGIAVARAWSIQSAIISAVKIKLDVNSALSRKDMIATSLVIASVCGSIVGLFALVTNHDSGAFGVLMVGLVFCLILADMPRQGLVYSSSFSRSLLVASVYLVGGLLSLFLIHLAVVWVTLFWMSISLSCCALGWKFFRGGNRFSSPKTVRSHSWHLSAEAIYSAIASQLGLILLFFVQDDVATSGYRLAYSLVFAPAFLVIQGIMPLFTLEIGKKVSNGSKRFAAAVASGPVIVVVLSISCGIIAWIVLSFMELPETYLHIMPFLFPVGLSLVSAQILEFVIIALRFRASERYMHRIRLILVSVDVSSQAIGILLGQIDGLILAMIIVSMLKVSLFVVLFFSVIYKHRTI